MKYAFIVDLEKIALSILRIALFMISLALFAALSAYLRSNPKYSKLKSVQVLERLENPSKKDNIYILKVVVWISAPILLIVFGSIFIADVVLK